MDTNESANKMIIVELGKEGQFLSGRSRAREIISNITKSELKDLGVQLDFKNIESCSQSFISELIVRLKEKGVKKGRISSSSLEDTVLRDRLNKELKRLEMV